MEGNSPDENGDEDEPRIVRPVYVTIGPKKLAKSKLRLADWLERRGW